MKIERARIQFFVNCRRSLIFIKDTTNNTRPRDFKVLRGQVFRKTYLNT